MRKFGFRGLLAVFSIICFYLMLTIKYDSDFRITAILPITYFVVVVFILRNSDVETGLGAKALVLFYAFRMCILPIICAEGNFFMEPNKSDYIPYYGKGVILISIECIIVFLSLRFFTKYFRKKQGNIIKEKEKKGQSHIIMLFVSILTLIVIALQVGLKVDYYTPITSQVEDVLVADIYDIHKGAWWYITDLLSTWWRPLVTISIIFFIQKHKVPYPYLWIILVAIINVYFMSERRIYTLLVGGFALYYASAISDSKFVKRFITVVLLGSACVTLFYGFYSSATTDLEIASRTFQHYFSGPTLNALALRVLDTTGFRPLEFIYLLLNDFQTYTAFFGSIKLPDYYMSAYGMSFGLWTPVTVGSFCYFGPFFPLVLVYFVYYIKRCDNDAMRSSVSLYSMIYYYLGVCVACYMIMYTVELIFYFILTTGFLFRTLIKIDSRIKIKSARI